MRGRSGQGSDRTGRAHSLITLPSDKVQTKFEVTLVRANLGEQLTDDWMLQKMAGEKLPKIQLSLGAHRPLRRKLQTSRVKS